MTPFSRPYDFLLVCHCNFSDIVYNFGVIWRSKDHDLKIYSLGVLIKVIGNGTIQ